MTAETGCVALDAPFLPAQPADAWIPCDMPFQYRISGTPAGSISPLIGCLPLFAVLFLMCLVPMFLLDIGRIALGKLGLSPLMAGLAIAGIVIGSLFNLPIYEFRRDELQPETRFGPWGPVFNRTFRRVQFNTVIAVNVGGCLIPVALAVGQVWRVWHGSEEILPQMAVVAGISIAVCWWTARPMEGVGILMPGFIPPLVSVLGTWLLLADGTPAQRAATAFVAGVAGPVIGADLLHLKDVARTPVAVMSIGGAGTFDGIVLSGILAVLLA